MPNSRKKRTKPLFPPRPRPRPRIPDLEFRRPSPRPQNVRRRRRKTRGREVVDPSLPYEVSPKSRNSHFWDSRLSREVENRPICRQINATNAFHRHSCTIHRRFSPIWWRFRILSSKFGFQSLAPPSVGFLPFRYFDFFPCCCASTGDGFREELNLVPAKRSQCDSPCESMCRWSSAGRSRGADCRVA